MVEVFRYGHRKDRDKRVTTHVGLVARAFGAKRMYLHRPDESVKRSIEDVAERWGGSFKVELVENWRKKLKELKEKGKIIVHLTMYGINLPDVIEEVKKIPEEKLVVFVGAEKVPPKVYEIADYNIAVGNQPHSEIAALAIFLDRYFGGEELNAEFKDAKLKIIPQEKGKKVITLEE